MGKRSGLWTVSLLGHNYIRDNVSVHIRRIKCNLTFQMKMKGRLQPLGGNED